MFVGEKTTSRDYNEASIAQLYDSYKKIAEDLLVTVENIISGISSVSTNNVNNFTECRIQAPANHPIVILLYQKGNEEDMTNAFPDTMIVKVEQEEETESTKNTSCSKDFSLPQSPHENDTLEENSECFFEKEMLISLGSYNCSSFEDETEVDKHSGKLKEICDDIVNHVEHEQILLKQQISFNNGAERVEESDTVPLHSCQLIPKKADDNCDKIINFINITPRNTGLVKNAGVMSDKNYTLSISNISTNSIGITNKINKMDKKKTKIIRETSNAKTHYCDYCEKTFSSSSHKKAHERIHTGLKPYGCSYCNKKFTYIGNKQLHERTHTGEKPYECTYCKKTFANFSNKAAHERTHTGEKPYKCDFCEKSFIRSYEKEIHQRIHTGERPYTCNYCDKTFVRFSNKVDHEKQHTGERPFKCDFCEKSFIRSIDKINHERIHTGEKPYSCDYCEKSFSRLTSKVIHEQFHSSERPYKCDICGKAFLRSVEKRNHERVHTGEKPFSCRYCQKTFARSSTKYTHERIHTGERPYKCEFCDKAFSRSNGKRNHQRIYHGE